MCSFLLLYQCSACSVCFSWMVLEMGGKWLYSGCFVRFCFQDLFKCFQNLLEIYKKFIYVKMQYKKIKGMKKKVV